MVMPALRPRWAFAAPRGSAAAPRPLFRRILLPESTNCAKYGLCDHKDMPMSLMSWMKSRFFCDLAIDLGTANTLVFLKGKGIIVQAPSIVVVNKLTGKVEAVGTRAKDMLGKTPNTVIAIKPMRDGVIADFEIAEKMLDFFIRRAMNNRGVLLRPRIVIGIPTGVTQVERRA